MATNDAIKFLLLFGPVAGMLLLGSWLSLRSGVVSLADGRDLRRMAENLSQAVVMIGACLLVLVVIQPWIGYRLALRWLD